MVEPADAAFRVIDEGAVASAPLRNDPYDFSFVENVLPAERKGEILADAPRIPDRGSYGLPDLRYGRHFAALIDDLLSARFRRLVEEKFQIDLRAAPPCIVMMGNTSGHYNEGYAHPDSRHKIITVLLGLSRSWPFARGRLRVLRSEDREDFAFEFAPEFGRMLMFRVGPNSWHGFLPQKGPRMSLQLCYVDSTAYVRKEYFRHALSARAKAIPGLRKLIDLAPRRLPGTR